MKKIIPIIVFILLLLLASPAIAEEAAKETEQAGVVLSNLDLIVAAIVGLLTLFGAISWVDAWIKRKAGDVPFKLWELAKGVVIDSYQVFEEELKKAKEDGVVTKQEIEDAWDKTRKVAKENLIKAAKQNGVPLLQEAVPALVEKAISYLRKEKAEVAAVEAESNRIKAEAEAVDAENAVAEKE